MNTLEIIWILLTILIFVGCFSEQDLIPVFLISTFWLVIYFWEPLTTKLW